MGKYLTLKEFEEKITEILTIKNELSKLTYQILSIENTLSYLQNDVERLKQKEIERNP